MSVAIVKRRLCFKVTVLVATKASYCIVLHVTELVKDHLDRDAFELDIAGETFIHDAKVVVESHNELSCALWQSVLQVAERIDLILLV